MDLHLQDKVVAITGGSAGIGFATAGRLLAEGARVAICGRDPGRLDQARAVYQQHGDRLLAIASDVSTEDGVKAFVDGIGEHFGSLYGLLNNAGRLTPLQPFEAVDDDAWQQDFNVKLFGAIRLTRLCLPWLRDSRGAVVNMLSVAAKQAGPRSAPTSVSRAAGLALTKLLSKELAPEGVRVNAVCVGLAKSAQNDAAWQREFAHLSRDDFYLEHARRRGVPLGRSGEAEEAADLIAFLLSDRAAYITGTAVNFDGGLSGAT